jgi:hypothetical protein
MVGKDPRGNLARELDKYRGIPFLRGSNSVNWSSEKKGLDCIGFIYAYYTGLGIKMPSEFKLDSGEIVNSKTYIKLFTICGKGDRDFYVFKYYDLFGEEIDPSKCIIGDAVLIKNNEQPHLIPAIYGGNQISFACFVNTGVQAFACGKDINMPIIKARKVFK